MSLFTGYAGIGFDEVVGDAVRPHYRALVDRLEHLTPAEFDSRTRILDGLFKRQGITFAVYGAEEGVERTWPLDLIPRIIPGHEWDLLEQGFLAAGVAMRAGSLTPTAPAMLSELQQRQLRQQQQIQQ